MNENFALVLALGIGFAAGLRSLTPPAVVAWSAHLGWLNLDGTLLSFMGSTAAVIIFTLAAVVEYVTDKLPKTPSRTTPIPLVARILMGALAGAGLLVAGGQSLAVGAVLGGIGGVAGAFAGYQARTRLVSGLKVNDAVIAVSEDLVTIGLAFLFVTLR